MTMDSTDTGPANDDSLHVTETTMELKMVKLIAITLDALEWTHEGVQKVEKEMASMVVMMTVHINMVGK